MASDTPCIDVPWNTSINGYTVHFTFHPFSGPSLLGDKNTQNPKSNR